MDLHFIRIAVLTNVIKSIWPKYGRIIRLNINKPFGGMLDILVRSVLIGLQPKTLIACVSADRDSKGVQLQFHVSNCCSPRGSYWCGCVVFVNGVTAGVTVGVTTQVWRQLSWWRLSWWWWQWFGSHDGQNILPLCNKHIFDGRMWHRIHSGDRNDKHWCNQWCHVTVTTWQSRHFWWHSRDSPDSCDDVNVTVTTYDDIGMTRHHCCHVHDVWQQWLTHHRHDIHFLDANLVYISSCMQCSCCY